MAQRPLAEALAEGISHRKFPALFMQKTLPRHCLAQCDGQQIQQMASVITKASPQDGTKKHMANAHRPSALAIKNPVLRLF